MQSSCAETDIRSPFDSIRLAIEVVPFPMLLASMDGEILCMNASWAELFGYTAEELLGQNVECLMPEELRGNHVALRQSFKKRPRRIQMGEGRALSGMHAEGHRIPVELGLYPVDLGGEACNIITAADISGRLAMEQVRADEAARAAEERRLRDRSEDLERIAWAVSHDLKGPLTSIAGLALLSLEEGASTHQDTGHLNKILSLAETADDRLEQLAGYARPGSQVLSTDAVDIAALVHEIWERKFRQLGGRFVLTLSLNHTRQLHCHRASLSTVIAHLFDNAWRYRERGQADEPARVRVSSVQDADELVLQFADNGVGLPTENVDRLFKPFARANRHGGHGLGLALVRRHIQSMGGQVSAERTEEGSVFEVRLPFRGAPE